MEKPRKLIVVPSHGRNGAHQFLLSDLPEDLRDALAEYDIDGDGTVTVGELAAGAHLLRKQADKARAPPPLSCRNPAAVRTSAAAVGARLETTYALR